MIVLRPQLQRQMMQASGEQPGRTIDIFGLRYFGSVRAVRAKRMPCLRACLCALCARHSACM